jgi:hypothetical protein
LEYIAKLFPSCQSTWERLEDDLDVDESFNNDSNSGDEKAKKEKGGDEEGKKDKVLEAVDSGCSGLLFLRFRVDVTPTHFIQKLIGMKLKYVVVVKEIAPNDQNFQSTCLACPQKIEKR